jgi:hypothetical protein
MLTDLLASIDSEISVLKKARALLVGSSNGVTRSGRKKAKRVMSAEARERIAAAQRKRWAKQKKAKQ